MSDHTHRPRRAPGDGAAAALRGVPTRRDALRMLAVSGAAALAWSAVRRGPGAAQPVSRSGLAMGTTLTLTVVDTDREAAAAAADATLAEMARLETLLSAWQPDSQVSRLNATARLDAPAPALLDVLRLAARISELGDGRFDLTVQPLLALRRAAGGVPAAAAVEAARALVDWRRLRIDAAAVTLADPAMRITVDGIATGYIIDRGVDVLRRRGFDRLLVDVGGDILVGGEPAPGRPWYVGVRHPRPGPALLGRAAVRDAAIATSGDYQHAFSADRRHHHIVDPRSGDSPPELASSTVIAPDCVTADALSTLTLVLGARRGRELLEALPGCEGLFVAKDLTVTRTEGFPLA